MFIIIYNKFINKFNKLCSSTSVLKKIIKLCSTKVDFKTTDEKSIICCRLCFRASQSMGLIIY